jgi:hypothetical protein
VWRLAAHTTVAAIGLIALWACVGWMFTRWVERGRIRAAVGPLEEGGEMSALAGLAGLLALAFLCVASVLFYFLPSLVAHWRKKTNLGRSSR